MTLGLAVRNLLAWATVVPLKGGIDVSVVAEGMEMMGTSSVLYPALKANDMILANLVVIILGLLTSILPAWRAASASELADGLAWRGGELEVQTPAGRSLKVELAEGGELPSRVHRLLSDVAWPQERL